MGDNMEFDFTQNVSQALKDKQLRKNFKFAMGNFILKRQQIFADKKETERLRELGNAINYWKNLKRSALRTASGSIGLKPRPKPTSTF